MQAVTSKSLHLIFNKAHESILQTLDRVLSSEDGKDQRLYRLQDFQNATDWAGVPLIFAQTHPDMDAYNKDPTAELEKIGGRIVGAVKDPAIDMKGHARLLASLDITDKAVEALNAEGKISLSTGFFALMQVDKDGVKTTAGPVKPHHVLLFEETRTDLPRDLGTGLLNKQLEKGKDGIMPEDNKGEQNVNMAPLLQELNASKLELKNKGEELEKAKASVTAKDAEIEAMKNKLAAIEKADKDSKWEGLKNSYIPPGLVAKESEEKALRELMEKDPVAFINKVESSKVDLSGKGPDGVTNVGKGKGDKTGNKDDKAIEEQLNKLGIPSITLEG